MTEEFNLSKKIPNKCYEAGILSDDHFILKKDVMEFIKRAKEEIDGLVLKGSFKVNVAFAHQSSLQEKD